MAQDDPGTRRRQGARTGHLLLAFALVLLAPGDGLARSVAEPGTARQAITIPPVPPPTVLLTVGADDACDYDDLDFAIVDSARFGAGQHTLRIAKNYDRSVRTVLFDRSLYFEGGYATCSSTSRSGRTELDGVGTASVFTLYETDGGEYAVGFDSLSIRGGVSGIGGGIAALGDGLTVTVRRTEIVDSEATYGGGVYVNRAHVVVENGTSVLRNEAGEGAGIYCIDGVVDFLDGVIAFNQAVPRESVVVGRGGGVHALRCTVRVEAGGPLAGIYLNGAQTGGGLSASQSDVRLRGNAFHAADVVSNVGGGGIEVDRGTLNLRNASVTGNVGAGIRATEAILLMDRGDDCHDPALCSRVSGNGSIGLVLSDTFAALLQTTVADNANGGVLQIQGGGTASLILSNSVVADNGAGEGSAILAQGGEVEVVQSTLIGERRDRSLIGGFVDGMEVRNSILWRRTPAGAGTTVFPIATSGPVALDCGIFDSTDDPPAGVSGIRVFVQAPRFVDFAGGDFHLRGDSPAIDRCLPVEPPERDIDRQERGFDIGGAGDPGFPDDIGADEYHFGVIAGPTPIFLDGFESGDMTRWIGQ